jgi:hypothetical protein
MNIRFVITIIAFAGIFAAFAQQGPGECRQGRMSMGMPPPGDAPMGMRGPLENPPMMMNITELQKLMADIAIDKTVSAKIIAVTRTFLKALDERILKIQREELNIKEELLKDKPDLQTIKATVNRKTSVLGEIEYLQIKRDLDIKSLLTADEYDRWKSAMMQKMKRMGPAFIGRQGPNEGGNKIAPPQEKPEK